MFNHSLKKVISCGIITCVLPVACTWVDLDEEAEGVALIDASQAAVCKLLLACCS